MHTFQITTFNFHRSSNCCKNYWNHSTNQCQFRFIWKLMVLTLSIFRAKSVESLRFQIDITITGQYQQFIAPISLSNRQSQPQFSLILIHMGPEQSVSEYWSLCAFWTFSMSWFLYYSPDAFCRALFLSLQTNINLHASPRTMLTMLTMLTMRMWLECTFWKKMNCVYVIFTWIIAKWIICR